MIKTLTNNLLQFIYPNYCAHCSHLLYTEDIFCADCASQIKPIASKYVPITPTKSCKVVAACAYEDPVRSLLLKKLSSDITASTKIAQLMTQKIPKLSMEADFFVPIPLHWSRYAHRGFNQASIIAKYLSKQAQTPMVNLLMRSKRTVFQSRLKMSDRQGNVENVFLLHPWYAWRSNVEQFKGKHLMLVDDLCTTGSTLKSAARALQILKPASINALVCCRGLLSK